MYSPSKFLQVLLYLIVSLVMGCGSGSRGENNNPIISGTPNTVAVSGVTYTFTPTAFDEDGDNLFFSITGLPEWARFNSSTGTVTGTPLNSDVGTSVEIVITVSDGIASTSLPSFTIMVSANSSGADTGSVGITWNKPTENSDGSIIMDLAGYKIYYSQTQSLDTILEIIDVQDPNDTNYTFTGLPRGVDLYFSVTAYDFSGNESPRSIPAYINLTP